MSERLFTYGSLMLPEVMAAVCGRRLAGEPATLADHARYALRGKRYPGLVPEAGAAAEGVVYARLTAADLARLDRFEGDEYARVAVQVACAGAEVPAFAYVIRPDRRDLLGTEPWDLARFEREDAGRWVRELRARGPI